MLTWELFESYTVVNRSELPPIADAERVALVQGLFIRHQPVVRAAVLALLPDFTLADDVVQETFLTATRKAADFAPGTNFPAWVCAIARFKAREALRRGPTTFHVLSDELLDTLCAEEPEIPDLERQLRLFEECIRGLSPKARRAIELRYRSAGRPGDVAAAMGWTVGAVKVALSRARLVLRDCIARKLAAEQAW